MDWAAFVAPVVEGLIVNCTYASAGYLKAREKRGTTFSTLRWLRTIITGALPPVLVVVLSQFGVSLPPGFELVSFLGPALDKLLRKWV